MNTIENIKVDGWEVTVTYMPDNGKYVAEAFDSEGRKFDYVASTDRQQTINTAVSLANAGEYYRPFEYERNFTKHIDDQRELNIDDGSAERQKQVIEYYPDWVSYLKNIMFYLLLFLIGGAVLLSLVVLAVSMGVTRP